MGTQERLRQLNIFVKWKLPLIMGFALIGFIVVLIAGSILLELGLEHFIQ